MGKMQFPLYLLLKGIKKKFKSQSDMQYQMQDTENAK